MENAYQKIFGLLVFVLFLSPVVSAAGPAAVNLGSSGNFVILSKAGISATGATSVTGNMGVSPAAATYITGFGLILDPSTQFSTSSLVNGKIYAADYSPPTPTTMTTAISDMQTAYVDAAGRTTPTATELGAGNIGGMTLAPGLYKWGTGVTIPSGVTLSGGANDVWIFQIAQTLNVGNGAIITLSGGAQPQNIFWSVAGQATLGTTSDVKGIILSKTAIVMNTGARLNGRALAQTAITMDANAVTAPNGATATAPPTPTPTPATTPQPISTGSTTTQTPQPTATAGTMSASTTTSASDNPVIVPTPASYPSSSASQAQIAQNIARGLPAGYTSGGAATSGSSSSSAAITTTAYTTQTTQPAATGPTAAQTPQPTTTSAGSTTTTAQTVAASTSAPASASDVIAPTPSSYQSSSSSSESQIARNIARGLPAGYVN